MFFRKLFKRNAGVKNKSQNTQEVFGALRWIEIGEKPFPSIRVLDVRPVTMSAAATTQSAGIAAYYTQRDTSGDSFRVKMPDNSATIACNISYPLNTKLPEGALSLSRTMEVKWDVFHFGGQITFVRSWTGNVIYIATATIGDDLLTITSIKADAKASGESNDFAVRSVDYLIKSHIFNLPFPNPIPPNIPSNSPRDIALACFSLYGRMAWFASYDDTTKITSPASMDD